MRKTSIIFVFAGLVVGTFGLSASTINFDFTSGNGSGNGSGRVFTDPTSGLTITATAWSLLNYGSTFSTAQLGQYSTGLGVCNSNEGNGCGSPDHQVDNVGSYDFILFQFSAPVTIQSITIDPFAPPSADRDVTYYESDKSNPIPLNLTTVSGLSGFGFGPAVNQSNSAGLSPLPITIDDGPYRAILFGASTTGADSDDYFKIASMTVDYKQVPEPATFWFLAGAFLTLEIFRRRFRKCA